MKLFVSALFALCSVAFASPVKTVAKRAADRKSGNLLQRNDHPLEMFTGAVNDVAHDVNVVTTDAVQTNPCFGKMFCPESNLPGDARGTGPSQGVDFFVKDFEKMDELPNYEAQKHKCHPKCRWTCDNPHCNSLCAPRCKAPKCVTACKKVNLSRCKRVCKDPQCAVVCPPQCEHGTCPKCKTLCGASVCALTCGQHCESSCADPDCVWDCKPNPVCAKPQCKMTCDTTVCSLGKDQTLPNENEVPYLGQEVAWKGLGKIPVEHLAEFAPLPIEGSLPAQGAKMFEGSLPLPPGGLKSITGKTGIVMEADKDESIFHDDRQMPQGQIINSPSVLTTRYADIDQTRHHD